MAQRVTPNTLSMSSSTADAMIPLPDKGSRHHIRTGLRMAGGARGGEHVHPPAVDVEDRAVDESGLVRGDIDRRGGDRVRMAGRAAQARVSVSTAPLLEL